MKKKLNLCGIFAIAMVALTTITITSCDKDEESLTNDEEYTLAERMMTRAGEGSGTSSQWTPADGYYKEGSKTDTIWYSLNRIAIYVTARWNTGYWYSVNPTIRGSVELIDYPDRYYVKNWNLAQMGFFAEGVGISYSFDLCKKDLYTNQEVVLDHAWGTHAISVPTATPPTGN